jgi:hypothetical protein
MCDPNIGQEFNGSGSHSNKEDLDALWTHAINRGTVVRRVGWGEWLRSCVLTTNAAIVGNGSSGGIVSMAMLFLNAP